jgi:uncharacterized protein YhbP (UPF0306 family)
VTIERRARRWSGGRLNAIARRLMKASPLCSLSTVSPGGRAHINHMYFAWNDAFEVFWISDADSRHSKNLITNRSAAVTIYDSRQVWGRPDRGIQLFGSAGVVSGSAAREAERAYSKRFRDFDPAEYDLPYYRFRPRTVKLFDERSLAGGTLVTALVTPNGLAWTKTEVWA